MSTPRFRRFCALVGAVTMILAGLVAAAPAQALVPLDPDSAMWGVNGSFRAILETPGAIYIGGSFSAVVSPSGQTLPRNNLAVLNPATGQPLAIAPQLNRIVLDLALATTRRLSGGGAWLSGVVLAR